MHRCNNDMEIPLLCVRVEIHRWAHCHTTLTSLSDPLNLPSIHQDGNSPITHAASKGEASLVLLLLERGAEINYADKVRNDMTLNDMP